MIQIMKRLQEVHANFWNSHRSISILGKNYIVWLLYQFTYQSGILILKNKKKLFNGFKFWILLIKENWIWLDCLQANVGEEFICAIFENFCKKWVIKIWYAIQYIYEKNNIAKQCAKTLALMKSLLIIDSKFLNLLWTKIIDTIYYLRNWLPIKDRVDKTIPILEEAGIEIRNNLKHV